MFGTTATFLPVEYWLCAVVLAAATVFALGIRREAWAAPFVAVLGTIAAWYMLEPFYFEDFFIDFRPSAVILGYRSLLLFLLAFVIAAPVVVRALDPGPARKGMDVADLHPEQIIPGIVMVWLALLSFGIFRMDGDIVGALFPVDGRNSYDMWGREAAGGAGASGFIISTCTYVYVLTMSLFGLLLPLTRDRAMRMLLVACIIISWPYAILQGSRNVTLAVITPAIASYLLLSKNHPAVKTVIAIVSFWVLDMLMRAIIEFRDVGFQLANYPQVEAAQHLGLNMASELIYASGYISDGTLKISHGWGYLSEALNFVPRAIWPDKPALGIDYAIARGFSGGGSDIGVFATLSTGIVGQGVLNFGTWLGPMAAALLMAFWVGLLARLRTQGGAARIALFLVGLGLTFNLGRDITMLVLFPFVFGCIGVWLLEFREKRRLKERRLSDMAGALVASRLTRQSTPRI